MKEAGLERRVDALAERFALPDRAGRQLWTLLSLLANDPLVPTSVRDPRKVIDDHLADSLVALELEEVRASRVVVDIGAGAGLPSLPLAIAMPEASFALVESAARKCAFLERALADCGVTNAQIVHSRVEAWTERLTEFDLATARAIAPLAVVVEYAAPLLKVGGALLAWRGQRDPSAEAAAARSAAKVGLKPAAVQTVRPYPGARDRHLHLMLKVSATPRAFPRRPGMAVKRPLAR